MKKQKYDEIIRELEALPQEKRAEYLLSVIEETDYDNNGWNDELRRLYNKYQHR